MKHRCPDSFGEATPPLRTEVTKQKTYNGLCRLDIGVDISLIPDHIAFAFPLPCSTVKVFSLKIKFIYFSKDPELSEMGKK